MGAEIDAAKVEALVGVLKDALPELVADAFAAFKADKVAVNTIAALRCRMEAAQTRREPTTKGIEASVSERQ